MVNKAIIIKIFHSAYQERGKTLFGAAHMSRPLVVVDVLPELLPHRGFVALSAVETDGNPAEIQLIIELYT
jgi:hypothetical protein